MTMNSCKICAQEFPNHVRLHFHLRQHKVTVGDYYARFFPRFDLLTKEPIPFKTMEQYLSSSFVRRENMAMWLANNPNRKETLDWAVNALKRRKDEKSLAVAPCWVALKTLMIPSIEFFETSYPGGYAAVCKALGMKPRHDYQFSPPAHHDYSKRMNIVVDTREQTPLEFPDDTVVRTKLHFGDYTAGGEDFDQTYIERKSLADLLGTLSAGYERFKEELLRVAQMDSYMVILCENPFSHFYDFPSVRGVHSRATREFIHHRVRELLDEFEGIQFLFVRGRSEAVRCAKKILVLGSNAKQYDLQFCYQSGLL